MCACGFCMGCCKKWLESNLPVCPACRMRGLELCACGYYRRCCFGSLLHMFRCHWKIEKRDRSDVLIVAGGGV